MERMSMGDPVSETQKFVQVYNNKELHITVCAVSQNVNMLALAARDFLIEPNQRWTDWVKAVIECPGKLGPPAKPERAWVKVYRNLCEKIDSVSKMSERIQTIKFLMPFLGESHKECWGEIQIRVKKKDIKLGRHMCFDTGVGKWVEEKKPIAPKKDAGAHSYVALRLYHQNYLPENQPDWHFEPVYAAIAGKDFYRIDAKWQDEEIVITAALLDNGSPEIPKHIR